MVANNILVTVSDLAEGANKSAQCAAWRIYTSLGKRKYSNNHHVRQTTSTNNDGQSLHNTRSCINSLRPQGLPMVIDPPKETNNPAQLTVATMWGGVRSTRRRYEHCQAALWPSCVLYLR